MLHPSGHSGRDLRHYVDFGQKCARETCTEARMFDRLAPNVKRFFLPLADGLDSFGYSSHTTNPLFGLMHWGRELLSLVAENEKEPIRDREEFSAEFPFLASRLDPASHAYCVTRIVSVTGPGFLKSASSVQPYAEVFEKLAKQHAVPPQRQTDRPHVHTCHGDDRYVAFLRHGLGIRRTTHSEAVTLKMLVDAEIDRFRERAKRWTSRQKP